MANKVLVVDDEEGIRDLVSAFLEAGGYEARAASNGYDGLLQLHEWQPDLVVSDLIMPKMDGYTFCHMVRQSSDVPIIVITGMGGESENIRKLNPTIDDCMTKPFSMDQFLNRVAAVLLRRATGSAPTGAQSIKKSIPT